MPDNLVYMYGKLSKAVEVLVTNNYDVRNRVWIASEYLFMVQPEGLPKSCRADIEWIHYMLTRYPADLHYKSDLEATYYRSRNSTAHKIAVRVWTLYHLMQSEIEARRSHSNAQ